MCRYSEFHGLGDHQATDRSYSTIPKIYWLYVIKVTVHVDLRGVFWGKQYSSLCINGEYINVYIIRELI